MSIRLIDFSSPRDDVQSVDNCGDVVAVDPSSGTAIMMEVARVLGQRLKAGWRPRRSIVFAR